MKFHLLLIALAASLLLLGCTATNGGAAQSDSAKPADSGGIVGTAGQQEAAPGNGASSGQETPSGEGSETSPQVVPDLPPQMQPDTNGQGQSGAGSEPQTGAGAAPGCILSLDKTEIIEGSSVGVAVTASAGVGQTATYSCGDEEKEMGTNGFFNRFSTCAYNTPGEYDVQVKVAGIVCASQKLTVLSLKQAMPVGQCNLINDTIFKDYAQNYFEASVNYSGYSPAEKLRVDCFWSNYYKSLGTPAFGAQTASGVIVVSCRYPDQSSVPDKMRVLVGDDLCGEIKLK